MVTYKNEVFFYVRKYQPVTVKELKRGGYLSFEFIPKSER